MQHVINISSCAVALLFLTAAATAQSLHFDGLLNSPLGSASLGDDGTGRLVVSNIGSSGIDGVRIDLDYSAGCKLNTTMVMGANGDSRIKCDVERQGGGSASLDMNITADGSGTALLFQPDYTGIGQQTYTLRLSNNGQVVYEASGLSGSTKMQTGGGLVSLPMVAYILTNPFGPWGGSYLTCFPGDGGTVITPPGGGQIPADFFEFMTDPGSIVGINSAEITAANLADFTIQSEEIRHFNSWLTGLENAHLSIQQSGVMMVDNLGSSGCDGVSIDPGNGTGELEVQVAEFIASDNSGGIITLEGETGSGEVDRVTAQEFQGDWVFIPDFSALGSQTYTLELFNQGQLIFQQGGMSGPALSVSAFKSFSKATTALGGNLYSSEWSIAGAQPSNHQIVQGPTILADRFVVRCESFSVADSEIDRVMLCGSLGGAPMFIESVTVPTSCVGTSYCIGAPNSAGPGAVICTSGSAGVAANNLTLTCTGLPANKFGIYFYGPNQIQSPFGNGFRCVGGPVNRLPAQISTNGGVAVHHLDNTNPPSPAGQISAGQVWNFQFWYRDPAAGGSGYNLSSGHSLLFTP
ncbi:MAG: hypothetical protein ACI9F9_000846 [Candidatus Paceibacteria bacterium]|jgi:hypothetical protein